jgi:predicted phage baseplate assembly protein
MPIPLPRLDTRKWGELMVEARTIIPHYTPSWTDHNAHDPGITLVELFAWLAEMLLYRLDRVAPAEIRAFLQWAGVQQRPARAAETMLCLRLAGSLAAVLPAGSQFADVDRTFVFESGAQVDLSAAWLELSPNEATDRGRVVTSAGGRTIDQTASNRRPGTGYLALGARPQPGDAFLLGFDRPPAASGHTVRLAVWTTDWTGDGERRAQLLDAEAAVQVNCAPPPNPCQPAPKPADVSPPTPTWSKHPDVVCVWEYWDGAKWQLLEAEDQTRALTLSGTVTLTGPANHSSGPGDPRYWVRCRLVSGTYDCIPKLGAVGVNAVSVRNAATVRMPEDLGTSDGSAGQSRKLRRKLAWSSNKFAGVLPDVQLAITAEGHTDGGWQPRLDWDSTLSDDAHFVVDPVLGAISFGNGRVGRVPPSEATIVASTYQVGGGEGGNIPARSLVDLMTVGPAVAVVQPFGATGGSDAESLNDARARALDGLSHASRAITAADLVELARSTPGIKVARAHAIPAHHPDFPCVPAAGVVTLVVMPECGSPPVPQPGFLAEVERRIEPLRPLTSEVHVTGPEFVDVEIAATLHLERTANPVSATTIARQALDRYLSPLHGGPDGNGWPFGRAVYETELLALLASTPGVRYVDGLTITSRNEACCGQLALCPAALVWNGASKLSTKGGNP